MLARMFRSTATPDRTPISIGSSDPWRRRRPGPVMGDKSSQVREEARVVRVKRRACASPVDFVEALSDRSVEIQARIDSNETRRQAPVTTPEPSVLESRNLDALGPAPMVFGPRSLLAVVPF